LGRPRLGGAESASVGRTVHHGVAALQPSTALLHTEAALVVLEVAVFALAV
jgi:hypothetical protein